MPDDSRLRLIRALGDTLDGLDVALCAFDDSDRTLAWNSTPCGLLSSNTSRSMTGSSSGERE